MTKGSNIIRLHVHYHGNASQNTGLAYLDMMNQHPNLTIYTDSTIRTLDLISWYLYFQYEAIRMLPSSPVLLPPSIIDHQPSDIRLQPRLWYYKLGTDYYSILSNALFLKSQDNPQHKSPLGYI